MAAVPGKPASNYNTTKRTFQIHNLRQAIDNADPATKKDFSLDVMGFQVALDPSVHANSTGPDKTEGKEEEQGECGSDWFSHDLFDTDERVRNEYYPRVKDFLLAFFAQEYKDDNKFTLPKRVEIFDHTIRRNIPEWNSAPGQRKPVSEVHVDQTPGASWRRIETIFRQDDRQRDGGQNDAAEEPILINNDISIDKHIEDLNSRGYSRVLLVNVWRPLINNVEDYPLGLADYRSIDNRPATCENENSSKPSSPTFRGSAGGDLVKLELLYSDFVGETYYFHPNSAHKWYYLPHQNVNEVTIIKCFDSLAELEQKLDTDGPKVAQWSPHTAFINPNAPTNAQPRESIEVRTLVFF